MLVSHVAHTCYDHEQLQTALHVHAYVVMNTSLCPSLVLVTSQLDVQVPP